MRNQAQLERDFFQLKKAGTRGSCDFLFSARSFVWKDEVNPVNYAQSSAAWKGFFQLKKAGTRGSCDFSFSPRSLVWKDEVNPPRTSIWTWFRFSQVSFSARSFVWKDIFNPSFPSIWTCPPTEWHIRAGSVSGNLWFLKMLEAEINPPERNGQVQLDVARVKLSFHVNLNLVQILKWLLFILSPGRRSQSIPTCQSELGSSFP